MIVTFHGALNLNSAAICKANYRYIIKANYCGLKAFVSLAPLQSLVSFMSVVSKLINTAA